MICKIYWLRRQNEITQASFGILTLIGKQKNKQNVDKATYTLEADERVSIFHK